MDLAAVGEYVKQVNALKRKADFIKADNLLTKDQKVAMLAAIDLELDQLAKSVDAQKRVPEAPKK